MHLQQEKHMSVRSISIPTTAQPKKLRHGSWHYVPFFLTTALILTAMMDQGTQPWRTYWKLCWTNQVLVPSAWRKRKKTACKAVPVNKTPALAAPMEEEVNKYYWRQWTYCCEKWNIMQRKHWKTHTVDFKFSYPWLNIMQWLKNVQKYWNNFYYTFLTNLNIPPPVFLTNNNFHLLYIDIYIFNTCVNPLTYGPLFVSCPACRDPQCKAEQGGLFMRPQVSYSTWQMFNRGNWSRDRPSPDCLCSTEDVRRMLPDCPQGAGGLPPPQVCVSVCFCHQPYFLHAKVKLYTYLFCFCGSKIKLSTGTSKQTKLLRI